VFTTDISGRSNLWKVNANGGWPIQLAQSDDRQYGETWSPDGKWILFQQDTAGNELWDIFVIPSEGGEVINLTNTPEIREEGPRWSPDGKTVALNHKPKDTTVYNIALMDWATRKVTLLTHAPLLAGSLYVLCRNSPAPRLLAVSLGSGMSVPDQPLNSTGNDASDIRGKTDGERSRAFRNNPVPASSSATIAKRAFLEIMRIPPALRIRPGSTTKSAPTGGA
jgi:dipeptidyl aminopeptidase/acylaminoacyl peptidase